MGGFARTPRYVLMLNRSPVGLSTELLNTELLNTELLNTGLLNTEPLQAEPLSAVPLTTAPLKSGSDVRVVFGFSGKLQYEVFLRQSSQALTPYPLVKGFLQRQAELDTRVLRLVVLDATGSKSTYLQAATSQAVVEAFDLSLDTIEVSHELILDESLGLYRIHSLADSVDQKGPAEVRSTESSPEKARFRNVS